MLLYSLLSLLFGFINGLSLFLPTVTTLPFGIDAVLVQGMGYFRFMVSVFPPLQVMMQGMLAVISFKLALKVIAMVPIAKGILHK